MTIRKHYTSAIILTLLISCSSPKIRSRPAIQSQDTTFSTTTLELKSNSIPDYVFAMKSLKHLSITGMDCDYGDLKNCWGIEEIPKKIRKLKRLTSLILNVNGIQTIPIELTELKELKDLDLSDNAALTSVDNIEKITSLEYLSLHGCRLTKLPERIGDLKKLKVLGLVLNNIDKQEQKRIKEALPNCNVTF